MKHWSQAFETKYVTTNSAWDKGDDTNISRYIRKKKINACTDWQQTCDYEALMNS
jgi:hypothetical protein